jgi:hypothetical protein
MAEWYNCIWEPGGHFVVDPGCNYGRGGVC